MSCDVEPLFKPLQVRGLSLANRIVMAPMTRNFSPRGVPGEDVAAYYRRRAEGGTGLLITEGVGIDHPAALGDAGLGESNLPHLYGDEALAAWKRVVDGVHRAGGKIVPQLWHQGVMREPGTGPHPQAPSVRPSGLWGPQARPGSLDAGYLQRMQSATQPMTESEIQDVIDAYGRSARHARELGFDGVAIHGAHGYLIDTFLWNETNCRTDAWGGDRRARTRFAAEVVRAVRREAGEAMPIFFRFSQWKQQDFKARLATTPQELEEVLGPIADAGVDVFDGSVRYFDRAEFDGSPLNLSGWARKLTGKLSMAIGGIGLDRGFYDSKRDGRAGGSDNIELLMARFERGEFDLVAVGRALLNEPSWTQKLRAGDELPAFDEARLKELV
ncbi:NADH:flavin oxidoreductase [Ramlibacter sp. WS9]|uniref:NADH:flavin oxidoreductase n=1 Tax=Ramlibacter sp. WS9 TaxID=1882741 RepID=UPI001144ED11|nr:NADH:flavin oxidoreductase [Ramlibacter sp. WS9]ROZ69144.1 NADH:flavin oxidoreductase [Ramlibacter sp. WS9]